MKILALHSDYVEFEPIKKALKTAEETKKKKKRIEECLVVFTSVESSDEGVEKDAAKMLAQEAKKIAEQVKTKKIVLYPYAHLSSNLAKPDTAIKVMQEAQKILKKYKYDASRSPFGWYKSFEIKCKGHPLAELSREFSPVDKKDEKEMVSKAIKEEEKLKSYWYIMDLKGKLHPVDKFDFKKYSNLKKFASYEKEKVRTADREPPHVALMKKLELVDHEPGTDSGNLRYYPKGRLVKKLIEEYVTDKVIDYGGVEVETPIMYDMKHPTLEKYLNKFPARQYQISSDKRNFFLRFAACFGQFLIAHDATLSYKNLPLRLYEMTRYSFRREQSGEVTGLRRLRAFTMPDVHALCENMTQAKEEFMTRFDLCIDTTKGFGLKTDELELAIRITKDFYEKNKPLLKNIIKKYKKPALVEMWDERKFYFVLKYEFNFVDNLDKASALCTDQIDVENGETYDITFMDKKGKKHHPIILHCSPSGAIERVIYTLLEKEAEKMKKGVAPMFPMWLSPSQVRILPVSVDKHMKFCEVLAQELYDNDIRADIDDNADSIGKKIRRAEQQWTPLTLVVGDDEVKKGRFKVRIRGEKDQKMFSKKELIKHIHKQTEGFPFKPLSLPRLLSKRPIFVG
ncbi:threonine--tRNA ligase [Candidatus Woesearchaeota archaeon]|nr:threonine--tRNA ligase [Candidatus Woesearchaeota archaeon]